MPTATASAWTRSLPKPASQVVGVSESGYYEYLKRAPSERSIRHAMLTDLITQVHLDSHGIYGGRRVHAEAEGWWSVTTKSRC